MLPAAILLCIFMNGLYHSLSGKGKLLKIVRKMLLYLTGVRVIFKPQNCTKRISTDKTERRDSYDRTGLQGWETSV